MVAQYQQDHVCCWYNHHLCHRKLLNQSGNARHFTDAVVDRSECGCRSLNNGGRGLHTHHEYSFDDENIYAISAFRLLFDDAYYSDNLFFTTLCNDVLVSSVTRLHSDEHVCGYGKEILLYISHYS